MLEKETYDSVISDLYTVSGACDMLEHIVTDILDIRKLESKKLSIDNKLVNIDIFMKDLIKTISQKINEKPELNFTQEYNKDQIIYIDPFRLKQILLNYLTNAVKYTNQGYIKIKIHEINDYIRFSISDTGKGIRVDDQKKIFYPFNQVSSDDSSRYGGIGLGLYLCKMLSELMGGRVGFSSEFKHGSTFWVEFPKDLLNPKTNQLSV